MFFSTEDYTNFINETCDDTDFIQKTELSIQKMEEKRVFYNGYL